MGGGGWNIFPEMAAATAALKVGSFVSDAAIFSTRLRGSSGGAGGDSDFCGGLAGANSSIILLGAEGGGGVRSWAELLAPRPDAA